VISSAQPLEYVLKPRDYKLLELRFQCSRIFLILRSVSAGPKIPDGSGLDLCRQIRTFDATTPILFYSALARQADVQLAISAGAQGYLRKPSSIGILERVISQMIDEAETAHGQLERGHDQGKSITYVGRGS